MVFDLELIERALFENGEYADNHASPNNRALREVLRPAKREFEKLRRAIEEAPSSVVNGCSISTGIKREYDVWETSTVIETQAIAGHRVLLVKADEP